MLSSKWTPEAAEWVPGPSVIMARSTMTLRHKANKTYSKITCPLPLDETQLIPAFVIFGSVFQDSNNSQYHKRLSKDENRPAGINLIKKSCPKTGAQSGKV